MAQNKKRDGKFYVEEIFYDILKGLRDEADRFAKQGNGEKPFARDVATAYDQSGHHKENNMKQTASTTMHFPLETIHSIQEITNGEHPYIASESSAADVKTVVEKIDCRIFCKFVYVTSLKSPAALMKAPETMLGKEGVECQITTLHRIAEVALLGGKGFKGVYVSPLNSTIVVEQLGKSVLAMKEANKFSSFLESDRWPPKRKTPFQPFSYYKIR